VILFLFLFASAAPVDCTKAVVQSDLNDCALADYQRADELLNAQWRVTFARIKSQSPKKAQQLRTAQRRWITERDSECDRDYPWDLGVSLDKMMNINCRTEMTKNRTKYLSDLAKGK